jgi:hypothetical protein
MFLGHYGIAFAAKRAAPRSSLGTLTFAAQLLDELWPIFLLLGLERVRIVPGLMAASPLDFVHYPISHSLATAAGWALLVGVGYFIVRRYRRGAWVVGAAVLSHWFLDAPMHRPDLPLWPGSSILVGAGLWNSVPATLLIEALVFAIGLAVYLRTTRALDRVGSWALWAMVAVLAIIYLASFFGPPPDERSLAVTTLGLWLFVPWSYWVDRHRELVVESARDGAGAEGVGAEARTRPGAR